MNLPGIFSVERADADTLHFAPATAIVNGITDSVEATADFAPICTVGLSSCTTECKTEVGQPVHQVELTYFTEHRPDHTPTSVYRITDTEGRRFLIGTGGVPHPTVSWTDSVPSSPTAKRGYTVKVAWKSTVGLLPLAE